MPNLKPVMEQEFDAFLAAYPRPLDRNVAHFYAPPMVTFNDSVLGNYPESVVAVHGFDTNAFYANKPPVRDRFRVLEDCGEKNELASVRSKP